MSETPIKRQRARTREREVSGGLEPVRLTDCSCPCTDGPLFSAHLKKKKKKKEKKQTTLHLVQAPGAVHTHFTFHADSLSLGVIAAVPTEPAAAGNTNINTNNGFSSRQGLCETAVRLKYISSHPSVLGQTEGIKIHFYFFLKQELGLHCSLIFLISCSLQSLTLLLEKQWIQERQQSVTT